MAEHMKTEMIQAVIGKAEKTGASLAGIAGIDDIKASPSYEIHKKTEWPENARSVLVLGLEHPKSEPSLDWWDRGKGGTPGNRKLMTMADSIAKWLMSDFAISARDLPYYLEKGGIFLKDAAVSAGLGIIGKNNLLITPAFGPRIRFRALFLDATSDLSGPGDFSPCVDCHMPCRKACPRKAFDQGAYIRADCKKQMVADKVSSKNSETEASPAFRVKYCRACEFACPAGKSCG